LIRRRHGHPLNTALLVAGRQMYQTVANWWAGAGAYSQLPPISGSQSAVRDAFRQLRLSVKWSPTTLVTTIDHERSGLRRRGEGRGVGERRGDHMRAVGQFGVSITARPPGPTGAVPSVVVVPLKLSVNVTVPVALGGDTLAVRTEHSPAGTGVWKIAPTTAQASGGSSGIGGFN